MHNKIENSNFKSIFDVLHQFKTLHDRKLKVGQSDKDAKVISLRDIYPIQEGTRRRQPMRRKQH